MRPTVFVSGAGVDSPQQIPAKHLKTGDMLAKALRAKLEIRAAKIENTQDLKTKCLDKDICGLLLKGKKKASKALKNDMQLLLQEFPQIGFASIDSSVLYVKNLEDLLPELKGTEARFVVFKKLQGSSKTGGKRLITSMATLEPNTVVAYGPMSNLVAGVVRGTTTTTKIPTLPAIKSRTKKLLQEEKAKRERKEDQKKRQDEKAQPPTGSQENDGSSEGRRAERERRRAEHRAKNNLKDKTPEEIAEMERRRRERMDEQSKSWNMGPDDVPPGGTYIEEDGADSIEEDEEHEVIDLD